MIFFRLVVLYLFVFVSALPDPVRAQTTTFAETFSGGGSPASPAAPIRWNPSNWDVQVHLRSAYRNPGFSIPHGADHGAQCEAPGADGLIVHEVTAIEDTVYQCANHLMTSVRADEYGLVSLTPPVMVDFSAGQATVSFEISTLSNSNRDWPSIVIQPFEESLALPLSDVWPDLNGYGRRALEFDLVDGAICPVVVRDFQRREGANKFSGDCNWSRSISDWVNPSAQTRQRVEIVISRTRVRVSIPALNLVWADMTIPDLGWDQGLVSLIHHSYTPFKDGQGGPNTWHWDTLEVSPSTPVFINQARQRWANTDGSVFDFSVPAPANTFLRGSAIGTKLEVSFDGGRSWEQTRYQPSLAPAASQPTWQFWHPVPTGTMLVMVRQGEPSVSWWNNGWVAKDISLFSRSANPVTTPVVTPPVVAPPVVPPVVPPVIPPIPPVTPLLENCRTVETVQQLIDGDWVDVRQQVTPFEAASCQ